MWCPWCGACAGCGCGRGAVGRATDSSNSRGGCVRRAGSMTALPVSTVASWCWLGVGERGCCRTAPELRNWQPVGWYAATAATEPARPTAASHCHNSPQRDCTMEPAERWDLQAAAAYVLRRRHANVTLQFPDDQLEHAPAVAAQLQAQLAAAGSDARVSAAAAAAASSPPPAAAAQRPAARRRCATPTAHGTPGRC